MFIVRRGSGNLFFHSRALALQARHSSIFTVRTPSKNAPREAPTPLVFCSASHWDIGTRNGIPDFISMLAEKGYTCIDSDFGPPANGDGEMPLSSQSLLDHLSEELKLNLRLSGSPFPPVIFARGFASLIAQTYVSSNPAHGLFLISPPLSNASLFPSVLPTHLGEFDYEFNFPVAVMARPAEMVHLRKSCRLGQDESVDLVELDNLEGRDALLRIEQWLDELGI
ncbi:hypothetical protein K503DRAFT_861062 [Rhizopogon vinicolor AM-OR11-026]|uniref:Serine aminopeptidase S33 domain-containing protein n=1 Tax=Rhizopogon vinicolor AM-OR11-026 TaxID=1314800 RepID=A0A1B7NIS9_9AGAM|nr:hypothetical protein K503DRAFT_861062 [Rhizopogon vinicolor AM-OR11-026]